MQFKTKPKEAPKVVAPDKIGQLRALADKIEDRRVELDDFLNEYAKLISPSGVPAVNVRMMLDARGMCICQSALFAIAERVRALELEQQQALEKSA